MKTSSRPGSSIQLLTLALTLNPAVPSVLAAPNGPTALSGTYKGAIVDWPQGETGTVSSIGFDPISLATGPVDEHGPFSIQLPDEKTANLQPIDVSGLVVPHSDYSGPADKCVGQGSAAPQGAHFNEFGFTASTEVATRSF